MTHSRISLCSCLPRNCLVVVGTIAYTSVTFIFTDQTAALFSDSLNTSPKSCALQVCWRSHAWGVTQHVDFPPWFRKADGFILMGNPRSVTSLNTLTFPFTNSDVLFWVLDDTVPCGPFVICNSVGLRLSLACCTCSLTIMHFSQENRALCGCCQPLHTLFANTKWLI